MILDNREEGCDELGQAKLVMLKLLRVFDDICRKNNLKYWLDGGTLIGAIRHNGFIPWDDDIDVAMLSDDYEKFIEIAQQELPDDVFLQTRKTDKKYPLYITKLRDKYSTYEEQNVARLNCHKGIFIDIFPMDYIRYPFMQRNLKLFLHGTNYSELHSPIKSLIQQTIGRINRKIISLLNLPIHQFFNKLFHSDYLGASKLAYRREINETFQFSKHFVFPLKEHVFEGYTFFIPNNYDAYLREYFGDYMQLPPENMRCTHHIGIEPFKPCNHKEILYWKSGDIV